MLNIGLQDNYWGGVDVLRQTSNYLGVVEGAIYVSRDFKDADIDYLLTSEPVRSTFGWVAKKKKIFIHMENARIWKPTLEMLSEYSIVISPFDLSNIVPSNSTFIRSFPCVPWFYGIEFCTDSGLLHKPLRSQIELGEMAGLACPTKSKLISMIVSGKAGTYGHAWRCELAMAAKKYFGSLIDIYGFGHTPIPDKRIAIDPYIYSIVIENDCADFYVTEKVVDCLIGWAIPIYSGAEQLDDLLGHQLLRIPFGCSIDHAIKLIKRALSSGGLTLEVIKNLRDNAMNKLNLFEAVPELLNS